MGSDLYTKKALKRAAYVAVRNILVDNFPELATITTDHVRIKYNNLRTYFLKELKKTVDAPSGSAGGYVTRWELFGVMSFLKDTLYNYITVPTKHFLEEITDLVFADDAVIFAESLEVLVMALEALHEEAKPLGLEVSWLKTKVQENVDLLFNSTIIINENGTEEASIISPSCSSPLSQISSDPSSLPALTISFMQHTVTTSTITIIISCRQHRNTTTVTVPQLTSRAKPVKPAKEEEN
ncbi:hypothetical protein GWK47_031991 [Chionoecetes opilio]|uniref:MADF domain-containing protein n=1 Tax=Chionoecetes opilio TaxID=41210 RepID=A0A8J4YK36_CHIOP|nr:hypothetical protein GWK47_031991 [Chionoecetes opilio]